MDGRFKLNIEANHATLAGHTFQHELAVSRIHGMLGSVDSNQGDPLLGWDTDEFPTDLYSTTLAMYEILKNGGLHSGGLNFDAKVRRASMTPLDVFHGHIVGMDSLARGLKVAAKLIEDRLLDEGKQVLRNAILWNDTRTTKQCQQITETLGDKLLSITRNVALEGFTLPKILWVKEHEPEVFQKAAMFLLPKDYVRFRMTGTIGMDYSDAAGTLLLDVVEGKWSRDICDAFSLPITLCPPLVGSAKMVGTLLPAIAREVGLLANTRVFAGGADNACGAIGAGVLSTGDTMCSIGTSGVVLSYEENRERDFRGKVHFFKHAKANAFYTMGVTLAAGFSLSWFKNTFAPQETYYEFLTGVSDSPVGARGLLFTPYLVGERTPYADAMIRGSFIGVDASHRRVDFARAVLEGITFSLNDSIELFRAEGKQIHRIVSIGGRAKNHDWLQMQADIFNAAVVTLESEQGPGMGAAMLAAYGCGWFASLEECATQFTRVSKEFHPIAENVTQYRELYRTYREVYPATQSISTALSKFRNH